MSHQDPADKLGDLLIQCFISMSTIAASISHLALQLGGGNTYLLLDILNLSPEPLDHPVEL
jgi:hypothetical protein